MDFNRSVQDRLTGKTIELLSKALDYRSANHNVISANLANIDTPGYQSKALEFDKTLQQAIDKSGIQLKKTNPKHHSHFTGRLEHGRAAFTLKEMEGDQVSTSKQLNIDKEMAKMVQNNLLYEAATKFLSKKFGAIRMAIEAGRR